MALTRKVRKETDQAIRHLMDYIDTSADWSDCFRQIEIELVSPVADKLGIHLEQAMDELFDGPYEGIAYGYLFEEMATWNWNNRGSVIDEYLKKRGWREGPHGRKYLRALAVSDIRVWKTTDVSPGEWVEVQLHNENGKPKRVFEKAGSEQLTIGQHLAARVLNIDKKRCFSGVILPLTEHQAKLIQQAVDAVSPSTKAIYQEMLDEKEIENISDEEINEDIKHGEIEVRSNTIFALWAKSVLGTDFTATPEMRNTDDEAIVLTKHQMKITGDDQYIHKTLDQHFEQAQPNEWIWLNDQKKIIATIRCNNNKLELEANSVERGERGLTRLKELLGDAIGNPMGVHESFEQAIANRPASEGSAKPLDQEDLQYHPEVKAQLQQYLQNHYRDSLDQPIPMLSDMTPRECAANPKTREKAIHWLKNMELHNLKTGQIFDTTWMWEELNLTDYR